MKRVLLHTTTDGTRIWGEVLPASRTSIYGETEAGERRELDEFELLRGKRGTGRPEVIARMRWSKAAA